MALSITLVPTAGAHGGDRSALGSLRASATDLPERIDLPDGWRPEGITSAFRSRLYVGSLADGAIWRGSARTGEGQVLVEGVEGRMAVGLHVDWRGRLWVAGGNNHTVRVYNALTGRLLETYTFDTDGFINDLAITRTAVYATDSQHKQLAVVPLGRGGRLPAPSAATLLPLTGDEFVVVPNEFNANGIVAKGNFLIMVQSNTGKLFRVDPTTGDTSTIDTGGYSVTNGDGLALHNGRLYVVRNQNNLVAVFNLGSDLLSATLVGEITSPAPGALDVPTTATFALGKLWVVNARFNTLATPTTEYWITRLPTSP
jgi:sugar lactone lactonase YvrE